VRIHDKARGRGRVVQQMPAVEDLAKTFREHLQLA
jgi:hypothetical protein